MEPTGLPDGWPDLVAGEDVTLLLQARGLVAHVAPATGSAPRLLRRRLTVGHGLLGVRRHQQSG